MKRKSVAKKICSFALSLVILFSPIFLTGCFEDLRPKQNSTTTNQNTTPTGQTGGGNGGGSSSSSTPPKVSLSYGEYDDYFENYRITYTPTQDVERDGFNQELLSQNQDVANKILTKLLNSYGSSEESDEDFDYNSNPLFSKENDIKTIVAEGYNYYLVKEPNYLVNVNYSQSEETREHKAFNHENAIGNIEDVSDAEVANRLQLAELLILNGFVLNEDGSGTFDTEYQSHLDSSGKVKTADFSALSNTINHLGFTQSEIEQIQFFVLNYLIGKDNVQTDNNRFVNVYYDSDSKEIHVVKNSTYNRFLNDETYAMALNLVNGNQIKTSAVDYEIDETIEFSYDNGIFDNSLVGLCDYATEFLGLSSRNGFESFEPDVDEITYYYSNDDVFVTDVGSTDEIQDGGALHEAFSSAIYKSLIKTNYRNSDFDANFWNYDSYGNSHYGEAKINKNVVVNIDGVQRTIFSIRLPYFKNYFNTTHKIVNETISSGVSVQTRDKWRETHNFEYPYDEEYPSIPLCYFADYDNSDMLFDGSGSCAKMFSGYQNYQNMVLMPKKLVELESGALFITRELAEDEAWFYNGTTDGYGDFDLTVYVRYYDATTGSFATWQAEDGTSSEFYVLDTITVKYVGYRDEVYLTEDATESTTVAILVPNVVNFSIKDILSSAETSNFQDKSPVLEGFEEDAVLSPHESTLISKENYGYLFNYVETPDGNQVICFDGQKAEAPSYFELVFSCPEDCRFQFCFYPTVAYKTETA